MKYEAWLKINYKYKLHLIGYLTIKQYDNFRLMFYRNPKQAEYILIKKMYLLFDIQLKNYNPQELIKLYKIAQRVGIFEAVKLFKKFNYNMITIYNADKFLLYLRDLDNFKNISWGPGNHKNINDNVTNHYIKHVLSSEYKYWKFIHNEGEYKQYAIDAFYKMIKIIIHTDGKNVYLSGFYNHVFIIGRYHNDTFGISSCYYVENGEKIRESCIKN